MRRADRLFQIVQLLRRGRATTAKTIASELRVSERTIYRDVQDLVLSGVPIQGEAGVGYALPPHFDLPPLMFDAHELQALVLGARMVQSWSDDELARAARSALAKVEHVLPPRLAARIDATKLFVPDFHVPKDRHAALGTLRAGLEQRRVVRLDYADENGRATRRDVRPLGLFYWGKSWTLTAWCELRADFRNFRLDRIDGAELAARTFRDEAGKTLDEFLARMEREQGAAESSARGEGREPDVGAPQTRATRRRAAEQPGATSSAPRAATKTPKLPLSDSERDALRAAGLSARELAVTEPLELARRTQHAIPRARCTELVALARFQQLGSVGLETARDFVALGFECVDDLRGHDAKELYARMCELTRSRQDPCVEDAFRCAIAQAEHPDLPARWREWHRWTPLRGSAPGTLPPELRATQRPR